MTQLLVKTIANFNTTLSLKVAIGATTGTLTSGLDDDGIQLPTATYGFTIDGGNSQIEHFTATLTGSALTNVKTVTYGTGVGTAGFAKTHRKGAEVIISDHVAIKRMMDVLDGTTSFDSATPLGYDGAPTISTGNQFATKTYVDGVAIAGAPDSSTTTKGVTKMSVAPASATSPIAVGDNDPRVPTQNENDALVGTSGTAVSSSNKLVDAADVSSAGASDKIVRLSGTSYPTGDGSAITGISSKKHSFTSDVTLINSAVETDLLTFSLAGNTLGTANVIKGRIYLRSGTSGSTNYFTLLAANTFTLKLKYGATTIATAVLSQNTTNFEYGVGVIDFTLHATGATNTQEGLIYTSIIDSNGAAPQALTALAVGTAAEDSTANKTLSVTGTFSAASVNNGLVAPSGYVELI